MKQIIIGLILLFFFIAASAQEKTDTIILDTPENWKRELIHFPLSFAPELKYTGVEDIRFMKGWSDTGSEEFWSYLFVWYVDSIMVTEEILERDMEKYFNGLMRTADAIIDTLSAPFVELNKEEDKYTGRIKVFDAFFCKEMISLNVTVEYLFCVKTSKYAVIFRLSPKRFEHWVWAELNERRIILKCTE